MELPQLLPQKPTCRECELGTDAITRPGLAATYVAGSLPPSSSTKSLILFTQNPGWKEDKDGDEWGGRASAFLKQCLSVDDALLLKTCSIYKLNVARCSTPAGFAIKKTSYSTCYRQHSYLDILSIARFHNQAKMYVIGFGLPASIRAYQLIHPGRSPGSKISAYFGSNALQGPLKKPNWYNEEIPKIEVQMFSTYHPAAIMRENKLALPFSEHLSLITRHIKGVMPKMSLPNFVPQEEPV